MFLYPNCLSPHPKEEVLDFEEQLRPNSDEPFLPMKTYPLLNEPHHSFETKNHLAFSLGEKAYREGCRVNCKKITTILEEFTTAWAMGKVLS